jgi:hypothetical protein
MTAKKTTKAKPKPKIVDDPDDQKGTLKVIGGSRSDRWNNVLANQAVQALWLHPDPETKDKQFSATVAAAVALHRGVVGSDQLRRHHPFHFVLRADPGQRRHAARGV